MSLRPTRFLPCARFISQTRVYARMHVRTHTSVKRERKFRQACVTGAVYWGGLLPKGNRWKGRHRKRSFRGVGQKRRSSAKKSLRPVLRAIKIEIGRNRLGNALITPVFTHLRRFLSDEITSRVPTLSFCKVPLEISNECVEVETRMHAARDERRQVSRFTAS